jgi:glucose-1-phosphate thymidylyltransferase
MTSINLGEHSRALSVPKPDLEVIGLIPCGGRATRLAPLPMSKELYPIGWRSLPNGEVRPKVVSHYVLEQMRQAGIRKAFLVLRPGKWDLPAYFGDGKLVDMHLGYLVLGLLYGVPYSLDQARPFVENARVALGFPDILLEPGDVYGRLLAHQLRTEADVVLGLFPCDRPEKAGMVAFDPNSGLVEQIIEKPKKTDLRFMWATALWTPTFTEFLHDYVVEHELTIQAGHLEAIPELPIGDVIQAAIADGLRVEAEVFDQGTYLDIGTPEDLVLAIQRHTRLD